MKISEIRGMEDAAIVAEIQAKKKELLEMRCKVALGDEVNPMQLKQLRKDIARMKTVLVETSKADQEGGE